jgi:hypothetical protein
VIVAFRSALASHANSSFIYHMCKMGKWGSWLIVFPFHYVWTKQAGDKVSQHTDGKQNSDARQLARLCKGLLCIVKSHFMQVGNL